MTPLLAVISRNEDAFSEADQALAQQAAGLGARALLVPPLYHLLDDSPFWKLGAEWPASVAWISSLHPRPAEALLKARGVWRDGHRAFRLGAYPAPADCWAAVRAAFAFVNGSAPAAPAGGQAAVSFSAPYQGGAGGVGVR